MAAPVVHVEDVCQAVLSVLSGDARLSALSWVYGRRSPDGLRTFPAGLVALDSATDVPFAMPTGRRFQAIVLIFIRYRSEVGVGDAETQMHGGLDSVLQVLYDNPSLGLSYVAAVTADIKTDSNPAESPYTADALVRLSVHLAPR